MPRKFAFRSDIGTFRKNNEDVVWVGNNISGDTMVLACDGLGGHAGGEVASAVTLAAFQRAFVKKSFGGISVEDFRSWFNATITNARMAITNEINKDPSLETMATTVTGAIITSDSIYVLNCGDSRTYVISKDGVTLVTEDHNVYNLLRNQNADPEVWEKYKGRLHSLTACVGAMNEVTPFADVSRRPIGNVDYVVACTDGFSSFVEEQSLHRVYAVKDLARFVDGMIALAIAKDSNDNISLAISTTNADV